MSFMSNRPGAYGRLLLAVYVQWKTGLLVSSDWLCPVTRGAGGRAFRTQWARRAVVIGLLAADWPIRFSLLCFVSAEHGNGRNGYLGP